MKGNERVEGVGFGVSGFTAEVFLFSELISRVSGLGFRKKRKTRGYRCEGETYDAYEADMYLVWDGGGGKVP